MILIDKNNDPQNTIYYISGIIYGIINSNDGIDYVELLKKLNDLKKEKTNINFYSLALDFLFLLDKLFIDERGGLHVS